MTKVPASSVSEFATLDEGTELTVAALKAMTEARRQQLLQYTADLGEASADDQDKYLSVDTMLKYLESQQSSGIQVVSSVPGSADGKAGDSALITSGDTAGSIYEKVGNAWVFKAQYRTPILTANPATTNLPAGYQWILTGQTQLEDNGIYEWDGSAIKQVLSTGQTPLPEVTITSSVPANTDGKAGDLAFVTSGDTAGAIYKKGAGAWVFVAMFNPPVLTTPPTAAMNLPTGYMYYLSEQTPAANNGLYTWKSGTGGEQTVPFGSGEAFNLDYRSAVPAQNTGSDGDQVFITRGDQAGAVYVKNAGVWRYVTTFRAMPRSAHPPTAKLPAGFEWRLSGTLGQAINGIYRWDGFNIVQITTDGSTSSGGGGGGPAPTKQDERFVHTQTTAAKTWTVTHNLNSVTPAVTVYDSSGKLVFAQTTVTGANSVLITFSVPTAGKAVIDVNP